MPQQLVAESPEVASFQDFELPALGPRDIRIQSRFGAVKHGTESAGLAGYAAARGRFDEELNLFVQDDSAAATAAPKPIGNMIVGAVSEVGANATEFRVGDTVTTHAPLRNEHVGPADRCWKVPDGVSWKSAVCLDPAQFAVGAARDGNVRIGDAVAVFGLGAIGLMAVQADKATGAGVVLGIDPAENRRAAATICGADAVFDPTTDDVGLELKQATSNRGADVAIEYSGSVHAMQAALRGVAFGGTVVAGAFPPPYGAGLDFGAEAHINRPQIVFSRAVSDPSRDHPRWDAARIFDTCWDMFRNGTLSGDPIVTPVVPFEKLDTEFPKALASPDESIKLGCFFD